jgi:hypothetical protein
MNKNNAKDFLPLVQALADGKTIQFDDGGDWVDVENLITDPYDPDEYRIKPSPRTFELMRSTESGNVYDMSLNKFNDDGLWERITVQEVLK